MSEGVALFHALFEARIADAHGKKMRTEIAREIAAEVNANYIEPVPVRPEGTDDPESGELLDWAVRVLLELSKEPDDIGVYAAEVAELLQEQDEEQE